MIINLEGKTAIVTGASGGIGLAIAQGLAASGAHVIVNGRRKEAVDAAVAEIGDKATGYVGDLSTSDGCAALAKKHPSCDILINNLGIYDRGEFFETDDDVWEHFFQVNVMSGVRLSRAYIPGMKEKNWGRVVFISSESAFNIPPEMVHYGFTKLGQIAISRGLAKTLAGTNVTINSVLPGPTLSEGLAKMLKPEQERTGKSIEELAADFTVRNRPSSIIRRAATVEEVANMVVYVCSEQASATTGANLRVEGGVVDSI